MFLARRSGLGLPAACRNARYKNYLTCIGYGDAGADHRVSDQRRGATGDGGLRQALLAQEVQNLHVAMQAACIAATAATVTPTIAQRQFVDLRFLGRPDSFDAASGWEDWNLVFRSCAAVCLPRLTLFLERTERSTTPVLNATLAPDERAYSAQLYYMLLAVYESTALTRIVNAGA